MLPFYINLLRNFPQTADVKSADQLLEESTRKLIWQHLLGEANKKKFYYSTAGNVTLRLVGITMISKILKEGTNGAP
ncbi:uncharacterized protein N7446_005404 [Penicillium canescens]|uniref:uncharacterized protein n=1 Tax=Penicillium canescens TaxID=5083 RepID=UPI0026DF8E2D|nr:uncharacterized protein N7446_005404 [Penicillium canescens]KAJ6050358.1 hypothetical protein N7444_007074 [Penicillium canescens]KAJ6061284.1 hypothetical protein N7446_005404 [Penicillium canescens]